MIYKATVICNLEKSIVVIFKVKKKKQPGCLFKNVLSSCIKMYGKAQRQNFLIPFILGKFCLLFFTSIDGKTIAKLHIVRTVCGKCQVKGNPVSIKDFMSYYAVKL